jgi:hypothetical protein
LRVRAATWSGATLSGPSNSTTVAPLAAMQWKNTVPCHEGLRPSARCAPANWLTHPAALPASCLICNEVRASTTTAAARAAQEVVKTGEPRVAAAPSWEAHIHDGSVDPGFLGLDEAHQPRPCGLICQLTLR